MAYNVITPFLLLKVNLGILRGVPIPGFVMFQGFLGCWVFPNSCQQGRVKRILRSTSIPLDFPELFLEFWLQEESGNPGNIQGCSHSQFCDIPEVFGVLVIPKFLPAGKSSEDFKEHLNTPRFSRISSGILAPGGIRALFPNDIFRPTSILSLRDSWEQMIFFSFVFFF